MKGLHGVYELVLIWSNGDKDVYQYDSWEDAEKGGRGVERATGNQLSWWCVRVV